METNQFDKVTSRSGWGSLKWDKYAGRDILPMWVADMDFVSPRPVLEALEARVAHGVFGYTIPPEATERAVLNYLKGSHGLEVEREWLVWLPGLVPALNTLCRSVGETGDDIMTCTPVYPPFLSAPGNGGRRLLSVPLREEGGCYRFDFERMEAEVTDRTRLFILCNPHNPVGRVFSRDELGALLDFCERHQLLMCSDEIHCDLILEDLRHHSWLSLGDRAREHSVTLMAASKTYNLPGLACAFAIIPNARLRVKFRKAMQGVITEVNCFGYAGCEAAYREGEAWRQELLVYLRENRDWVYDWVQRELTPVVMHPMEATYLAWLDVRALGLEDPVAYFERYGVGLSDGRFFGDPGFVRLNFGCPRSVLREGLERMAVAVREVSRAALSV